MKRIPVTVRIIRAIASQANEGATVKEIAKITGMKNQNISACLWKLKADRKVSLEGGVYKLTGVNKVVQADAPVQAEIANLEPNDEGKTLTLGKVARKLAQENERLKQEVRRVESDWRNARQSSLEFERKYFDALAVISYLESK